MGKRNPNGYGCVTRLKGNRSRPWVVKVTVYDRDGRARQTPVGYAATEADAHILLAKYNDNPWDVQRESVTLVMLFNRWKEVKASKLSDNTRSALVSSFRHMEKYYGMKYRTIKSYHMQDTIDHCGRGPSTQGHIKTLWYHLDRFAFELNIIDRMYSQLITSEPTPETSRVPFSSSQIGALWALEQESSDPFVEAVLIYIYTGFRLSELLSLPMSSVDLNGWTITAGVKTKNGKNRIVPIHDRIKPFFLKRADDPFVFTVGGSPPSVVLFRKEWRVVMEKIDAAGKTPHEARHTFETLLDNAGGNRKCIDMLMGHKSTDTGNRVYNHKTLDQLRDTIALLK